VSYYDVLRLVTKLVGLPSVVSWRRYLDYLGSLLSELLCLGE
jgi:hypothetical protein